MGHWFFVINGKCHDLKRKGVCRRGQKGKENPQQQTWSQKVFKKGNWSKTSRKPKNIKKLSRLFGAGSQPRVSEICCFVLLGFPRFLYVPFFRGVLAIVPILIHRSFRKIIPSERIANKSCMNFSTVCRQKLHSGGLPLSTRVSKGIFGRPQRR